MNIRKGLTISAVCMAILGAGLWGYYAGNFFPYEVLREKYFTKKYEQKKEYATPKFQESLDDIVQENLYDIDLFIDSSPWLAEKNIDNIEKAYEKRDIEMPKYLKELKIDIYEKSIEDSIKNTKDYLEKKDPFFAIMCYERIESSYDKLEKTLPAEIIYLKNDVYRLGIDEYTKEAYKQFENKQYFLSGDTLKMALDCVRKLDIEPPEKVLKLRDKLMEKFFKIEPKNFEIPKSIIA